MLQQIKNAHQARASQKGFTLIELLMVIVILGILSGVVVFAVNGINNRGNAAACKSDVKSVEVALEAYYANTSGYPAADDWTALTSPPNKFLHEQPTTTNGYSVHFTNAGVVTSTPANCVIP